MYYPSPDYLRQATKSCKPLVEETGYIKGACMNISNTVNLLIQNTGRFTERYAGDLLVDLAHLYALTGVHAVEPKGESVVLGFGIRKSGVDHNAYIMNNLTESAKTNMLSYPSVDKFYRKVFVVTIDNAPKPDIHDAYCTVRLFDVTESLGKMTEEDMAWNPDEDVKAHYADRPECAGNEWNHWASWEYEIKNR